jgi:hypothetical protein
MSPTTILLPYFIGTIGYMSTLKRGKNNRGDTTVHLCFVYSSSVYTSCLDKDEILVEINFNTQLRIVFANALQINRENLC